MFQSMTIAIFLGQLCFKLTWRNEDGTLQNIYVVSSIVLNNAVESLYGIFLGHSSHDFILQFLLDWGLDVVQRKGQMCRKKLSESVSPVFDS